MGPSRPERLTRVTGPSDGLRGLIERALAEDAPSGDLTTDLTIPEDTECIAELRAKTRGVLSGVGAAQAVFDVVASQDGRGPIEVEWRARDGDPVGPGDVVAVLSGPARSILRAERVAVNLLAHLSGVATLTNAFVRGASNVRVRRKTPVTAIRREHGSWLLETPTGDVRARMSSGLVDSARLVPSGRAVTDTTNVTSSSSATAIAARLAQKRLS